MDGFLAIARINRRTRLAVGFLLLLSCPGAGLMAQGRTCLIGMGRSMLPTLPEYCRLVVVRVPLADVSVGEFDGDIIATRLNGRNVVHRVITRRPDGSLVTRGDNNPETDAGVTTAQNYVGVVVGFEKPGSVGELLEPAPRISQNE
jgi:hypothetical protein